MRRLLTAILIFFGAALPMADSAQSTSSPQVFASGQVWTLKGDAYPGAQVLVNKVEKIDGQVVVEISVLDVPVRNIFGEAHRELIGFMAFTEDAMRESVDSLTASDHPVFVFFEDSYGRWKASSGLATEDTIQVAVAGIMPMMQQSAYKNKKRP